MSSKVVAFPGDPVDAIRNAENTADMQGMVPMIDKDAFDLVEVGAIAAPSFAAAPYDLDTLTKYPVGNAGSLHIWGSSPATPGGLQFYVVLYDASDTLMAILPETPAALALSAGQDGDGDYHSLGLLDLWVATAAKVGIWVVSVTGGPWRMFIRPY